MNEDAEGEGDDPEDPLLSGSRATVSTEYVRVRECVKVDVCVRE